ncbi:MAG: MoaD/ThiS family protein [Bryobacteraceae bacterium]
MATVYIPTPLRELTAGQTHLQASGSTVRQIIDDLEARFPGLRERLVEGGRLRTSVSVAVDGEVGPLGLLERVPENGEVHFVTAIAGG